MQNEKILIKKLILGEQKAIRIFYQRYSSRLLNFILTKVEKREDAEEILQDTFMSALDSLPTFKGNSSLFTWLCSIARHEIADFYRKKKIKEIVFSRFPSLEHLVCQALSPQQALEEKELKEKIARCFASLSEGYAQVLRLKYIDGYSYKEIAKKLKSTVKAIESKIFRARTAFAKVFLSQTPSLAHS